MSPIERLSAAIAPMLLAPVLAGAQTMLSISPDVTVPLSAGDLMTADEDVMVQAAIVGFHGLGALPPSSDLIGFALGGGRYLMTFDTTVALSGGVVARPGDVVAWNGAVHSLVFDATREGIPRGVQTDAVAIASTGGLILSFDTDVSLPGSLRVADEDLVRWNGTAFSLAFDGSAAGLDRALDIDGVDDLGAGGFLVSFDTSGTAASVAFSDEDIVRYASGTWSLERDNSGADADWVAADLDAFQVPEPEAGGALLAGVTALVGFALAFGRGCARRPPTRVRIGRRARVGAAAAIARAGLAGTLVALLVAAFAAPVARAADGALEISQTCAVTGGCFPGDTSGFPVTIANAGSYRLSSNLTVPNENTDGIVVSTRNVAIDLNGFAIIGPVVCTGTPVVCTPSTGTGSGVERVNRTNTEIRVHDGSVTGMGNVGLWLGDQAEVSDVRVSSNRVHGIQVESTSIVSRSSSFRNGEHGIVVAWSSIVRGNVVAENDGIGIAAFMAASENGPTITGNTVFRNATTGISAGPGSNVSLNAVYDNGLTGVSAGLGSLVYENAVYSSGGNGLSLPLSPAGGSYFDNLVDGSGGSEVLGGRNMGGNACGGTATCP